MVVAAFRTKVENDIADPVVSWRSGVHVVKILKREPASCVLRRIEGKIIEVVLNDRICSAKEAFLNQ